MAKIITLSGKSASGKNYIYNALLKKYPNLIPVVTHTTRPKRENEVEGKDYFYINSKRFIDMIATGEIFEWREYDTASGRWYYGTSKKQIDLQSNNTYIAIVDLEGLNDYIAKFGSKNIVSYYVKTSDSIRLLRNLERDNIDNKKRDEIIRRFYADDKDFKKAEDYCKYTVYNNNEEDFNISMSLIGYELEKVNF